MEIASQEDVMSLALRTFLDETVRGMAKTLPECVFYCVFKLDEVGRSKWEDQKT
jgi:hypothetical protein